MTNPVKPMFRLLANNNDITSTINDRLISLHYTDETGNTSDMLEINLSDHIPSKPIAIPPTGAQLTLFLGYDGVLRNMGVFMVDEIELSGPPGKMHLRARAASFDELNGGVYHLQTQKLRHWKIGTTISAMVQQIAKEHGMIGKVAASLASIQLPNVDQQDESDLNMLLRVVGKKYDAVIKPIGNLIIVAKRGDFQSVSGQPLPTATLVATDCTSWHMTEQRRDGAGTVVAAYHDKRKTARHYVSVGSGQPVLRIKQHFQNQAEAQAAATAELTRRKREQTRMSVTMPGRTDLVAEAEVTLQGWRTGVNTTWLANKVEHSLDSSGYVCTVEMELPNPGQTYEMQDSTENPA
jgi:phage protein D